MIDLESTKQKLEDSIFYSPDGCHYFTGSSNYFGYGQIVVKTTTGSRRTLRPHRLSFMIHKGEIPSGMDVLHSCDNRLCVNPDHLSAGTHHQNMSEMATKKRSILGRKLNRLNKREVLFIYTNPESMTINEMAIKFNVSIPTIARIRSGETFSIVTGASRKPRRLSLLNKSK